MSTEEVADLDPPETLLVRWGALAAAHTAIGETRLYSLTAEGAETDDYGGNSAYLVFAGGGRAVCYGYDHEYSDTPLADPPVDLLDGGPEWLPWERLVALNDDEQLGWCYWYDEGRWLRAAGSGRVPDGRAAAAGSLLSDEDATEHLAGVLLSWMHLDPEPDQTTATAGAATVLAAARARRLTPEVLTAFLEIGRPVAPGEVAAGMAVARVAGLVEGSASPLDGPLDTPATQPAARPPRRRRRLSAEQQEALARTAARAATELARPEAREGSEVKALVTWLRRHDRLTAEGVAFEVVDTGGSAQGMNGVPREDWREAFALAQDVRRAETDPERGAWTWLRVQAKPGWGRGAVVTRAYDHLPAWWADRGPMGTVPVESMWQEMSGRSPQWRPPWSGVLDPATLWERV